MGHTIVRAARGRLPVMIWAALCACSITGPADHLDARLTLDETVVTSGATSTAQIEVTNHGSEAIEIEAVTCPPRVLVFDDGGDQVGQPSVLCPAVLTAPAVLGPGATHTWTQGWFASDERGAALPPGTYRVQAWLATVGGDPVLTNRVAVSVREPS